MTLNEAALLLNLRPATLRQQIHNGKLKAKKVGRDWTVTPSEVERYRRDSRREILPDIAARFGGRKT